MRIKAILMASMLGLSVASMPMVANADTETAEETESGAGAFDEEWEISAIYKDGKTYIAKMAYGYDDDFINEDYVWTRGYDCKTQASLTNYKGTYSGGKAAKRTWSIKEVTHKGNKTVTYRIWMNDTYESIDYVEDEGVKG